MKRLLICVVGLALSMVAARPAAAYDDEVHYALTYYAARCTGYTATQATRIANACVGVDYAFDTEPVQMHGSNFGANLWLRRGSLVGVALELLGEVADYGDDEFQPQSPLDFLDPEQSSSALESPGSLYNQGPRLRFHGFVREPGGESGKPWYLMSDEERADFRADEARNLSAQERLLWLDGIKHQNPGVFLHFFQDLVPHGGYGAKYGHYDVFINKHQRMAAGMPQGPITDWMSFRATRSPPEPGSNDPGRDQLYVNRELFAATAARLGEFMKSASERQIPIPAMADDDLLMKLIQANSPPKGELRVVADLVDYKRDDTRFRPSLEKTQGVLSKQMKLDGMEEGAVPAPALPLPYQIQADRKYVFGELRNQDADFYEPDPVMGWRSEPGAESDAWVLWGDLTVKLVFPEHYEARHRFEVVVLLPATHQREREYELKSLNEPWESRFLKDDAPVVLHNLPVGEVVVELRRADGTALRHPQRVPITRREGNVVEVMVDWGEDRMVFLQTDHQLIDPRFDLRKSSYSYGDLILETNSDEMVGPVTRIHLTVHLDQLSQNQDEELVAFDRVVNERRPRDQAGVEVNDRRDVGPREVLFLQRWLRADAQTWTAITGFFSLPDRGNYFCTINGAPGVGHDQLLAEWERLKSKVNALLELRVKGVSPKDLGM